MVRTELARVERQRIIDELVGHQSDEQRRRDRDLFPAVTQAAIARVFD
jgi:hypothetical protein